MAKVYLTSSLEDAYETFLVSLDKPDIALFVEAHHDDPPGDWYVVAKLFCSNEFVAKMPGMHFKSEGEYKGAQVFYRVWTTVYSGQELVDRIVKAHASSLLRKLEAL